MTGKTEIGLASDADRSLWDDYVSKAKGAALFHDWRWGEAVRDGFGHQTLRLTARRGGQVVGVLPLTDVRSALFGRSLISAAFAIGGGALADDAAALAMLGARAIELGRERLVNYVELRGGDAPGPDWHAKTGLYAAFSKALPAGADDILQWLPKNRRSEVRKAVQLMTGGNSRLGLDGAPEEFHALYATAMRRLGTPVFSVSFVRALMKQFGADAEISIVERAGRPAAGLLSFWFRDAVMPYYIGGTLEARKLKAYDYLYYSLMRRAIERGAKTFDFGRSRMGSSHHEMKTYWGFEPRPLVYHVALVRAKSLPNVNPDNPKFAAMSSAWRRLPLPIANAVGPLLARHLA
jgi:FemAB-related protein (PEP-CTERM system-associated)